MFLKEFEIRWSDLDANRHLANVSYITYAGEARLAFLLSLGLNNKKLSEMMIGPVVFNEQFFYFKEAFLGQKIRVSTALAGLSKEGTLFEFEHNFYNHKGENLAFCEMQGGWIDLKARKLTGLPESLLELAEKFPKSESFKILTKEDTRKHGVRPKPMEI